jgi:hypothetical protein
MELRMLATRRFASLFAIALAAVVLTSCADDLPTAPPPPPPVAPNPSLIGDLFGVVSGVVGVVGNVLDLGFTECPTSRTYSGSEVIGSWGGTIRVGPHRLNIPRGAVREPVRISAVAPSGSYAQIKLEPEGLQFERPVSLVMSYDGCRVQDMPNLRIVYVNEDLEILTILPTVRNTWNETATTQLDHFSRYMLAD